MKKEDGLANRQAIVSILLQNPSKDNLNFHFTLSYLLTDAVFENLENDALKSKDLSESSIQLFVDQLINL